MTLEQILKQLKDTFNNLVPESNPFNQKNTFIGGIFGSVARGFDPIYRKLDTVLDDLFIDTTKFPLRLANWWKIPITLGSQSSGIVMFQGIENTVIPIGTIVVNENGSEYATNQEVIIAQRVQSIQLVNSNAGNVICTTTNPHNLTTGALSTLNAIASIFCLLNEACGLAK